MSKKIHLQFGSITVASCGIRWGNAQPAIDPRKATCKNCQRTKYFKNTMKKIKRHLEAHENDCEKSFCKVCHP